MDSGNIFIIGHGYLGSWLASILHGNGYAIAALNRTSDSEATYPILEGDVSDWNSLQSLDLPFEEPDWIVHSASSSRGGADAYRSVFVEGVKNLHRAFPDAPIILTSSSSVYGQTDGSVVDESSETSPDRETSRLLCEAEKLVCDAGGIALRLAGIYGPSRSVHLKKMLSGSATIESGEVSRYLNQIHRDDAAAAISHLARKGKEANSGRIFNVADNEPITQRECYEAMANHFDLPIPPDSPPDFNRKRAWTNKIVANDSLRATGWNPIFPSFLGALDDDARLVPSIREQLA